MTQPVWLQPRFVLVLHDLLISEHGGSHGLRDAGLVDSALSRPPNLLAYGDPDLPALAAAYAAGIISSHPFVDGSERTGFAAAAVFLDRNGLELTASEAVATQMTFDLAAGDVSEDEYAAWLRDSTAPLWLDRRASRTPGLAGTLPEGCSPPSTPRPRPRLQGRGGGPRSAGDGLSPT